MRKFFTTILCMFALMQLHAQQNMELTAQEVAQRMMPGWNLGNTMEANMSWGSNPAKLFENNGGLAGETAWQPTKTTQAVIDYVKSQGFRSVRIPCAWVWGHIADADNYTIDAAWMSRVKEIVDYCINNDLYVLLNDHWDGGWLDDNLTATGAQKEKNKAVLAAIWTQIANEFSDYDDHLVFAGQNEPPIEKESDVSKLVEYQQTFIDAVRATGGKNEKRLLVVQGPSTDAEKTCNWLANKIPTDPSGKLAVEIHFYYPWNFWGMTEDANWGNMFYYWGKDNHVSGSNHNATWGEESQMTAIANQLKAKFIDKGIPVINGEYGVIWRTVSGANESQEKHNASIKYYYKFMNQMCMERGIVPMAWDTNSTGTNQMTIINRKDLTIYNQYMIDGIHEAMEAVGIPLTAISSIKNGRTETRSRIYDLSGRVVPDQQMSRLPKGVYIQNGRKHIIP
ncbi:MAG: glycoside hydrolase family 5 protein [Prevotella sp.]|nr:glycoside hydrolase family 5 protein [Prevotella sp.]